MGIAERRSRVRTEREHRIVATARVIAEREGWSAVTIRRLAEEIEYSQPVLYSHFENRDAIVAAVAVQGFRELTLELREAAERSDDRQAALENVALAYLAFAGEHPTLYEAMFTMRIGLRFAEGDTKLELKEAFEALAAVIGPSRGGVEVATETLWATLHGLAELERTGRIRQNARDARVALVVSALIEQ